MPEYRWWCLDERGDNRDGEKKVDAFKKYVSKIDKIESRAQMTGKKVGGVGDQS